MLLAPAASPASAVAQTPCLAVPASALFDFQQRLSRGTDQHDDAGASTGGDSVELRRQFVHVFRRFFQLLRPSAAVHAALLSQPLIRRRTPFVAVHLRWLEGECDWRTERFLKQRNLIRDRAERRRSLRAIRSVCAPGAQFVHAALRRARRARLLPLRTRSVSVARDLDLFIASDHEVPLTQFFADLRSADLATHEAVAVCLRVVGNDNNVSDGDISAAAAPALALPDHLSIALDFWMMVAADVFVPSAASSVSSSVCRVRSGTACVELNEYFWDIRV